MKWVYSIEIFDGLKSILFQLEAFYINGNQGNRPNSECPSCYSLNLSLKEWVT